LSPPHLLRVPEHSRSVDDVLGVAAKMGLTNIVVLSQREDGSIVFLENGLNTAQVNFLIDLTKMMLLTPSAFERKDKIDG
jgi:hypothetical protein